MIKKGETERERDGEIGREKGETEGQRDGETERRREGDSKRVKDEERERGRQRDSESERGERGREGTPYIIFILACPAFLCGGVGVARTAGKGERAHRHHG
jgi:hypothetical protein